MIVLGVERAAHAGITAGATILPAGMALLAAFLVIERRCAEPLARMGIFRNGSLVRANLSAMLSAHPGQSWAAGRVWSQADRADAPRVRA